MVEMIVRTAKGILMALLFGIFYLGILCGLFIFLPVASLQNHSRGHEPHRMQKALRTLVSLWLFLLRIFGLLESKPTRGKPLEGPCVLVANHPGLFDVLFLIRDIPRMSVMVKRVLAEKLPLGPLFRSAGYVLSPDYQARGPIEVLDEATDRIKRGYKFMVFPEATRSPKGSLGRFSPGPLLLARLTNVPVQPVFLWNDPPFLPKEDKWYFPPLPRSTLEIEFWEPLAPPHAGEERECAKQLEARYREALRFHKQGVHETPAESNHGAARAHTGPNPDSSSPPHAASGMGDKRASERASG
jgi:1-acyl-sn-glycerol-3-phosphate acyltransferase